MRARNILYILPVSDVGLFQTMDRLFSGLKQFSVYAEGIMLGGTSVTDVIPCKFTQIVAAVFVACFYNFLNVFELFCTLWSLFPIFLRFVEFACDRLLDITSEHHCNAARCMMAATFVAQCAILYGAVMKLFMLNYLLIFRLTRWLISSALDTSLVGYVLNLWP